MVIIRESRDEMFHRRERSLNLESEGVDLVLPLLHNERSSRVLLKCFGLWCSYIQMNTKPVSYNKNINLR